jgi:ribosomal protein S18 acetylase RimI-like enzyme
MSNAVMAKYSDLESRRFGCRVFRGSVDHIDPQQTLDFLINNAVDIAILRLPSMHTGNFAFLNELGMPYIVADTLVYYYCNLSSYEPKQIKNNELSFEATTAGDIAVINELVSKIFKDYTNHYYANPFMNKNDILDGYQEWAGNYITGHRSERLSWLTIEKGAFIGFIACFVREDECEIILNGVRPEASGRGIYSDMLRFIQNYFKKAGIKIMKVSTQVHNFAVQKVWAREGFFMHESFNTIHINSFLQKTIYPGKQYSIKGEEISACLTPKFIASSLSKHILKPASSFYIKNSSFKHLKSIDKKAHYTVTINIPYANADCSSYKLFQKVTDTRGNICLVAYYDLIEVK